MDVSPPPPDLSIARQLYQDANYGKALELLQTVVAENPGSPEANLLFAQCLNQIGRHEEALLLLEHQANVLGNLQEATELRNYLRSALAPPKPDERIPLGSYQTSIPKEFLGVLQRRLHNFYYKGVALQKNPFDLAIYNRLIPELRPRTIVEIGSKAGGSALWFADQCRIFELNTNIISVDLIPVTTVKDPRIRFIQGDAEHLAETLHIDWSRALVSPLLVIDDASHYTKTSMAIASFFHPFLNPGDYLVIEDGIISDLYPEVCPNYSSGPHQTIRYLLETFPEKYSIDRALCDLFGYNVTWCTNGFLKVV
jgi:cephalosporin hydroxylase